MEKLSKNILLVEDNVIIALDQKFQLEKHGYIVTHAVTGENSIEIAKNNDHIIDLILMDIDLGKGIDGTQAAREILKIQEIPILFLSSHTEQVVVEKTEAITSYGYVVKNSGITVLVASIKMAFKLFKAHKDLSRLDRAIENTKDIVLITNRFGLITYINPQFTKTYGFTKEETVGKLNPRILNAGEISDKEDTSFWEGLKDKTNFQTEFLNKSKKGKPITVEASIDPIFNNNGEIIEFVQIHRDITDQKLTKENDIKKTNYLNFLNTISKEQANVSNFSDLTELITKQLGNFSNPIFVSFSEYDSNKKTFKKLNISAIQSNINAAIQVAGKKILKTEVSVDHKYYKEITSKTIRVSSSLNETTNGTVSKKVSKAIQKILKIDEFWSLFYVIDNRIYGGSLFALKKGQDKPDKDLLESFLTISSISLRRLYLESEKNKIEQESKNYLDAINSMDLGLFIVNEDYSVRYMNDTMIKWFGDQTNLICYKAVAGLTEPCPYCRLKEILKSGGNVTYSPKTEDGRTFTIHGSVLHNPDGTVSKLEIIQDITELTTTHKHVETLLKEKEIILKEVHHRIKNNMMTIMGLLTFQEQSINDDKVIEAFENTRNRVQSMMVLYDKLYRSNIYQTIWIKEYFDTILNEIIENFTFRKTVKLNYNIENIEMKPGLVFNLGIIINELVTNSVKHAVDENNNIIISVSAKQTDNIITFIVKDNGKGFPDKNIQISSDGFGLQLVNILSNQISADISFSNDNGAIVELNFKLESSKNNDT